MLDIKKYEKYVKSSSKLSSYVKGKIKTEREKKLHIRKFYYIFKNSNVTVISQFHWLI
jgi:cell fate regulator YaaT (PSP1 superfamily)